MVVVFKIATAEGFLDVAVVDIVGNCIQIKPRRLVIEFNEI